MDLNELLQAHQIEVMKANSKGNEAGSQSHYDKVALYAAKIRELRELHPASVDAAPSARPDMIIYGTYAGDSAPVSGSEPTESWESEGGSLDPPQVPLPVGIASTNVRQFFVGPYAYTDFTLALAEHAR